MRINSSSTRMCVPSANDISGAGIVLVKMTFPAATASEDGPLLSNFKSPEPVFVIDTPSPIARPAMLNTLSAFTSKVSAEPSGTVGGFADILTNETELVTSTVPPESVKPTCFAELRSSRPKFPPSFKTPPFW